MGESVCSGCCGDERCVGAEEGCCEGGVYTDTDTADDGGDVAWDAY